MRIIYRIIIIPLTFLLILHWSSMINEDDYAETIGIAPLFLKDLFVPIIFIIMLIIFGIFLYRSIKETLRLPLLMLLFFFSATYLGFTNYPSVKQKRILPHLIEYKVAVETYEEERDDYIKEMGYNQYNLRLRELKMFSAIYSTQYNFITYSINIKDNRRFKMSIFYGLIAIILLVSSFYFYYKNRNTD